MNKHEYDKKLCGLLVENGLSKHFLGFASIKEEEIKVGDTINCRVLGFSNKELSYPKQKIVVESLEVLGNIFYIHSDGAFYVIQKCKNDIFNENILFTIAYGPVSNNNFTFQIVQMMENRFPFFTNGSTSDIKNILTITGIYVVCSRDRIYLCLIR